MGDYDGDGVINCLDGVVSTDGSAGGGGSSGGGVSCGAAGSATGGPARAGWILLLLLAVAWIGRRRMLSRMG